MAYNTHKPVRLTQPPHTRGSFRVPEDDCQIPYPDLSSLHKEAIEDALREAWKRLLSKAQRESVDLMHEHEEPITRYLRDELDILRRDENEPIKGFSERIFQHIPESEVTPNSSGRPLKSDIEKPDLVFRLAITPKGVARALNYGLFVECKIIHTSTNHHSIKDYCGKNGLERFIDGRYAWTMPSGMMIAYVRNSNDIPDTLDPYLRDGANASRLEVKQYPATPARGQNLRPLVYESVHGRSKVPRQPGDIKIAHLWLHVAQSLKD